MAGDNDVRITVDADNRTTAAFGAAARGARTVGEATENANRAMRDAGNRAEAAAARMQLLASRQREAAERAQRLARESLALRTSIAATGAATAEQSQRLERLTREQDRAAASARLLTSQQRSATEQVNDLARAYRRAENNAQQALRASLMFGAGARLGPDGSIGAGGNSPSGLRRLLSGLPGFGGSAASAGTGAAGAATSNPVTGTALIAIGATVAAAVAPLIGGVVAGAVGAAGGIGGVGLGVAGAIANDPDEFRERWDKVIQDVTGRWVRASASWMEPVKGAIAEVDSMLKQLPIESILSNSAAYLEPLTKGLAGFGTGIAGGLDSLVKDAAPIMDMLGTSLPKLGRDIGDTFAVIGKGADGGAVALGDFLSVVGTVSKQIGFLITGLAKTYEAEREVAEGFGHLAGKSADWIADLTAGIPVLDNVSEKIRQFRTDDSNVIKGAVKIGGVDETAAAFRSVTHEAEEAAKAVKDYIDATQLMLDLAAGDKSAGLALSQGWITLNEELRDGKRTLDLNTQAGIDNQTALLTQVEAAEKARQAQLALGVGVESANAQFDANIERIRATAYQLGYNKTQVDALIKSLGVLDVTSAAPKVELTGAEAAMEQGISLGAILNRLDHTYTAKVQVVYGSGVSLGNALHHAAGGPTSGASVVNDWGPGTGELIRTPDGSTVIPAGTGRAMMQGLGGGGGVQRIEVVFGSDGSRIGDALVEAVASRVSSQGGRPELLGLKTGR